ncbi:hypothetical protein QN277_010559 [Acacia crassicarpa]|uniref:Alpha 1,4-glycosyltransferase domain-containing protein n=1 Tax=Acacia crassicarpa TaxID=499986 RepID=A0AAE1IQ02_9FABA|nr:hypothetical protein QN277_010559 [Acacia crassicarpa]
MAASDEKTSHKTFDYLIRSRTAKSVLYYAIMFLVFLLVINAASILSNSPGASYGLRSIQKTLGKQETPKDDDSPAVESPSFETEEDEEDDPMVPPENLSREERMVWFRTQLPKLDMLNPYNSSQNFHMRVLSFLNKNCSALFHIIWLSPAKSFGKREFLTLDSFFKVYPDGCLVILSNTMDSLRGYRILKPFLDGGFKVTAITPDLPFLFKDTPAESWLEEIKSGDKDPGSIPLSQNLSNLIRLAMLYRYGGIYMDADMLILKDFAHFRNAVGAQSVDSATRKWTRLNGAVMIFDIHHPILIDFMQEFATTFDGNRWGYNGPYLVSRVIERVGSTPGYNLMILPPKAFFPVDWIKIVRLLKKPENEAEAKWIGNRFVELLYDGETYTIHMWNKISKVIEIEEGSVIARLASARCVICGNITNI